MTVDWGPAALDGTTYAALAVASLDSEIQRFDVQATRYLDRDRYLIVFAEVTRQSESYEAQLHAFPRGAVSSPVEETHLDRLFELIKQPRNVRWAQTKHLNTLAKGDPIDATLFDGFNINSGSGLAKPALSDLFRASEADWRVRTTRENIPWQRPDFSSWRRNAYELEKRALWAKLTDRIYQDKVDDRTRNELDAFVFEMPDILALTIPLLGSPVVTCYFGAKFPAYYEEWLIIQDLYLERLHVLRSAVMPYFLSRLAALANWYLDPDHPAASTPEELAATFLLDAAGLLLAQRAVVPCDKPHGAKQLNQSDIAQFMAGEVITVALPKEWPGAGSAEIILPAYHLLLPASNLPLSPLTAPERRAEALLWRPSNELHVREEKVMVEHLLHNLMEVVYRAGIDRDKQQRHRQSLTQAFAALRRVRASVNTGIVDITTHLAVDRYDRVGMLVDALPSVVKMTLAPVLAERWNTTHPERALENETVGHFLKEKFDSKRLPANEDMIEVQTELVADIVNKATAAVIIPESVEEADRAVARCIVEWLLTTRLEAQTGTGTGRSLLGWMASDWRREEAASLTLYQEGEGSKIFKSLQNWVRAAEVRVSGPRGRLLLKHVSAQDAVPRLAVQLCLGLLPALHGDETPSLAVIVSGAVDSAGRTILTGKFDPPSAQNGSTVRRLIRDGEAAFDGGVGNTQHLSFCLFLMNHIYRLSAGEIRPDGFSLTLGA